jgi:hypothetical protein
MLYILKRKQKLYIVVAAEHYFIEFQYDYLYNKEKQNCKIFS